MQVEPVFRLRTAGLSKALKKVESLSAKGCRIKFEFDQAFIQHPCGFSFVLENVFGNRLDRKPVGS